MNSEHALAELHLERVDILPLPDPFVDEADVVRRREDRRIARGRAFTIGKA